MPCTRLVGTVFQKCLHAQQPGLPANGLGRFAIERHFTNGIAHTEHFIHADAALVAGVVAVADSPGRA